MVQLPDEIIDKILIKLNDVELACKLKRLYAIKKLLNTNDEIDNIDTAALYGKLELVKYFHSIDEKSIGPILDLVALNEHLDVVMWLYDKGYRCTNTAIDWAIGNNNIEMVKFLCSTGEFIYRKSWINIAFQNNNIEMVEYLLKKYNVDNYNKTIISQESLIVFFRKRYDIDIKIILHLIDLTINIIILNLTGISFLSILLFLGTFALFLLIFKCLEIKSRS